MSDQPAPPLHVVTDAWGAYEVAADSMLATAPRRRDGWWDRRFTAGRVAIAEFRRNQAARRDSMSEGRE